MAITITAYSAGIDVTAYLNTFVSPNYSPVGFGYFSSNPNDFSGNQYAVTEQPNLIPDAGEQAIVFESGGGGNSIDYDFSTHIVSGDLDAISFGYGVTYDGGTDSFPLSQLDLRISGLGLVDQTGAGSMVEALLNDGRIASITNLSNLLASGAINFVGSTGSDVFTGYAQNDTMTGGGGNDTLNGSDGTDTAAYSGNRSDYTVTNNAGSWTITDNRGIDGSDTLSNIEFAQFADQTMALVGNAAPVASNDSGSTVKNISTVIDVLANDTDSDGTLVASTVAIVGGPAHGSVTIDTATGKITYTPTTNYVGADSFTYTVKDDDGTVSNQATVNVGVASGFTLTAGDDVFIADQKGYATALEIDGGAGNDYISTSNVPGGPGFPYADTVYGGEGNDLIITGSGNDFVDAGAGDDVIAARGGNETVIGGAGNDTFVLRFFRNAASATTDTGTTTITDNDGVLWNGSFRPDPYPAAWTPAPTPTQGFAINGTATFAGAGVWDLAVTDDSAAIKHLTINWTGHDLTMTGGNETLVIKDYVNGTFGITLENVKAGGPGNDTLSGSGGIYTMVGVAGDDTYFVDDTGDVVLENANEGNDVVHASINYTLTANVENLVLEGDADLQGYGNDLDNMLYGNVGNNLLNGGAGADVMLGGAGSDTYFVDNTNDSVVENASEGSDVVLSTANYALSANVEALVLLGTADLQGYGNSQNNVIYGNVGNNLLNGGAGVDLMVGGAGNDTYFADDSSDSAFEIAGEGNDAVFSTAHYGLAADVETLILLGSADLQGYGNNQVNTIYGNAGNNLLNGAGGADLMVGGAGDDTYFVDDISDSAFESPGEGNDAVFSTVHYGLAADVETLVLQGSADLQGYGSNQANTLYGNTGNNLLNGAGGADTMLGGAGDDTYFVDDAGDVVFENPGEGTDAVFASVNCTLTANVEVLVLNGPGNLSGTGNALANSLFGNGGDNVLDGGAGVDVLQGNAGNDTFVFHIGEGGGDTVVDFAGNGAAAGDSLQFVGYGPGATFTNIDATHWQVNFNGGASHEIITFMNAASIDPTDYAFI